MAEAIQVGSIIAGYRLEALIGRGGMGVVFRAGQPELDRQVAIKLIAPELARDEGFRERFRRESRLAATIEHPNAIPIYDAGVTEDEVLYLAMRYVEGTDMRSLIGSEGRLEPARAARLVDQVAGALDEAHSHGLVHRDVKPGNVLVSRRRGREHAYLTDFGLTKDISGVSGLTATGQWVGTVDYACPEQIEGKRVDARADVYALGCVLFEALTGKVPFDRESELAKLFAHANDEPPPPSTLAGSMPAELDDVVARSLAKDPDQRFPSAGDLGRAAVAAAAGREVAAPERTVAAGAAAPAVGSDAGAGTVEAPSPTVPADAGGGVAPPPTPTVPAEGAGEIAPTPEPTVPGDRVEGSATPTPTVPGAAAEGTGAPETGATEPLAGEAAPPERPSVPTRPLPPEHEPSRRRRLLPVAAALAALAAALGAAFGFGLIGGGDDGEGIAGSTVEFQTETPGGAYQVDLPAGWTDEETEVEQSSPDQLRTRRMSPDGNVRVGINRFVGLAGEPRERAERAEQFLVNQERIGEIESFERLSLEPVELGDREAVLLAFEAEQDPLGATIAFAYFFNVGDDDFRVQGNASQEAGADARELAEEVAERAASTLREPGG